MAGLSILREELQARMERLERLSLSVPRADESEETRVQLGRAEQRELGDVSRSDDGRRWVVLPKPKMGRRFIVRDKLNSWHEPFATPWRELEAPSDWKKPALLVEVK